MLPGLWRRPEPVAGSEADTPAGGAGLGSPRCLVLAEGLKGVSVVSSVKQD